MSDLTPLKLWKVLSFSLLSLEQTLLHSSRGIMLKGSQMQHSIVFSWSESQCELRNYEFVTQNAQWP